MRYIEYPSATSGSDEVRYPVLRRGFRVAMCGLLFAVPCGLSAPNSPLLRLSLTQENAKKEVIILMMRDFFCVNFLASAAFYYFFIERRMSCGQQGFMPFLGPVTAQAPAMGCLVASHSFYPGMWILLNEHGWRTRMREYFRLSAKCFFAFSSVHIPAAVLIGVIVGSVMYPFKYLKLKRDQNNNTTAMLCS